MLSDKSKIVKALFYFAPQVKQMLDGLSTKLEGGFYGIFNGKIGGYIMHSKKLPLV